MVGQFGIKLALNLISTHFGTLVTKVCECLLRKGTLTLPELVRFTQLSPQQVKNCLLVLIQHNCVQAFAFKNDEDANRSVPKGTHYTAIYDNIIHRMRFPKFFKIVSKQLNEECADLLEGLLQHGRLTLEQIILRSTEKNQGDIASQDAIRENFTKLVYAHYVERCPASESIPDSQDAGKNPSTGKRGAKSAKFVEPETVEHQAIAAAVPSERFSIEINSGTDVRSEANTSEKPPNVTVGEKRKIESLELDDATKAMICEREVLWRANFEEFVRHLRHKACVASVRSLHDDGAGIVLNAMLELTRKADKKVKIENSVVVIRFGCILMMNGRLFLKLRMAFMSVPLSVNAIFDEVIKSEEGRSMTLEYVEGILSQLGCHQSRMGTEELYSVDLKNIIEIAQNDEVELLVSARYGKDAYKMFRFLSKAAKLKETDEISDTAFVEKKEALKILYLLWKDGYLHMEKIVSHGAGQSQLFLWKINKPSVREHVFDEMCHASLNLRLRMAYELEQERELLSIPKGKLVGAQAVKYTRIAKVNKVSKKVTENIGSAGYWCESCQKNDDECSLRYIMVVKVSDPSGEAWLSVFNEQAEKIIGCSADELDRMRKDGDEESFKLKLKQATWAPHLFRVSVTQNEFNNEKRQRITVRSEAPLDFVAESKFLLEEISKMQAS